MTHPTPIDELAELAASEPDRLDELLYQALAADSPRLEDVYALLTLAAQRPKRRKAAPQKDEETPE